MRLFAVIILFLVFNIHAAFAQTDVPTTGMLYNTSEASALTYDCSQSSNGKLECAFTQSSVRNKLKLSEMEAKIKDAKDGFLTEKIKMTEDCKPENNLFKLIDLLEGNKTTDEFIADNSKNADFNKDEFLSNMKSMDSAQKKYLLDYITSYKAFCDNSTEENFLKVVRAGLYKDSKTCTVSSNSFTQTFVHVADASSEHGVWVVESKPEGDCGIVRLDRFVADKQSGSKFVPWTYFSKKFVTNKAGEAFLMKCNVLDENEYFYDWKTSAKTDSLYHKGCEYIEFSPI